MHLIDQSVLALTTDHSRCVARRWGIGATLRLRRRCTQCRRQNGSTIIVIETLLVVAGGRQAVTMNFVRHPRGQKITRSLLSVGVGCRWHCSGTALAVIWWPQTD